MRTRASRPIDFVNRVNFLSDRWQPRRLLEAFSDDVIVDHPLGGSVGKAELEKFLETDAGEWRLRHKVVENVAEDRALHFYCTKPNGPNLRKW